MCVSIGQGDNGYWVRVADLAWSEVNLERRSPVPGYCIVAWKGRHVSEPTELSVEEADGYWQDVLAVGQALAAVFHPVKLNYMMLGNTLPHLHTHVIPRYEQNVAGGSSDPAPGGPIPWEEIFGAPPRMEAELRRHAQALRSALGLSA